MKREAHFRALSENGRSSTRHIDQRVFCGLVLVLRQRFRRARRYGRRSSIRVFHQPSFLVSLFPAPCSTAKCTNCPAFSFWSRPGSGSWAVGAFRTECRELLATKHFCPNYVVDGQEQDHDDSPRSHEKIRAAARRKGVPVTVHPRDGKGSHSKVRAGTERTTLPIKVSPAPLRAVLWQLNLDRWA